MRFSLIQSRTRGKDPVQLLLKQMGTFLLMSLEIGSGPRGRSISQLDGSRAQLREKYSNGRAESMPQSKKNIRNKRLQTLQTPPAFPIITYTGNSDISNWVTSFSNGCVNLLAVNLGFFVNPCSHTVQRGDHQLSTWCLHISFWNETVQSGFNGYSFQIPGKVIPL